MKRQSIMACWIGAAALSVGVCGSSLAQTQDGGVPTHIKPHMEVKGSDGSHVGVVGRVDNDRLVLSKEDPAAGGSDHELPMSDVGTVTPQQVNLTISGAEARKTWKPASDAKP